MRIVSRFCACALIAGAAGWFAIGDAVAAGTRGLSVRLRDDAGTQQTVALYSTSYALVIGINAYTGGWQPLAKAVEDAEAVAEGLTALGFDVTLKRDLKSSELQATLRAFFVIKGQDPEARLFLWFAGHGHTMNGEGFLVPADSPLPSDPAFLIHALPMRDFGSLVRLARAKHVLAVFDSCFSGTIFSARGGPAPAAISAKTLKPVRQFLTSGDAGQVVRDDGSFRDYFLRAVRGEEGSDVNKDGYVTGSELGLFMSQKIATLTSAAQTPRFGKLHDVRYNKGDFVFQVPGGAATATTDDDANLRKDVSQTEQASAERALWQSVRDSNESAELAIYLKRYPKGLFAELAQLRIAKLKAKRKYIAVDRDRDRRDARLSDPARPIPPPVLAIAKPERPGDLFRECRECPEMVLLPAGHFEMGAGAVEIALYGLNTESVMPEVPRHAVRLGMPFAMSRREIIRGEFLAFAAETGRRPSGACRYFAAGYDEDGTRTWRVPGFPQGDDHPVVCVSWRDARDYAAWLAKRTGQPYRLPSESEWEYAARASSTAIYPWGDDAMAACAHGNAGDAEFASRFPAADWPLADCSDGQIHTAAAGSFPANRFKLLDMIGNVAEWVGDCWFENHNGALADGRKRDRAGCGGRVVRGGGFRDGPVGLRAAMRRRELANQRDTAIGFRVVRDLQ